MALLTHLFFGFLAKWIIPRVNIFVLLLGPVISDILFFTFVGLGIETYPDISISVHLTPGEPTVDPGNWQGFSHGLVSTTIYAFAIGAIVGIAYNSPKIAWTYALLVLSHFPVDLLCHPMKILFGPNAPVGMPMFVDPNEGYVFQGYGLWTNPWVVAVGELGMLLAGIILYVIFRMTHQENVEDVTNKPKGE